MDEEGGGRGWEKLAPEERVKLLRERRDDEAVQSASGSGERGGGGSSGGSGGSGTPGQGFVLLSPSR